MELGITRQTSEVFVLFKALADQHLCPINYNLSTLFCFPQESSVLGRVNGIKYKGVMLQSMLHYSNNMKVWLISGSGKECHMKNEEEKNLGNGGLVDFWFHSHRCCVCKNHPFFWVEVFCLFKPQSLSPNFVCQIPCPLCSKQIGSSYHPTEMKPS